MNHIWQNILRTAIAGAERHPVSEADLQVLGITEGQDAAQTALRALPAAKLMQQAAAPLAPGPNQLPAPCPPDERPICSPEAAAPLKTMLLHEAHQEAFPEFFNLLQQSARRLPPELVPLVLDWAARRRVLFPEMAGAIGPTGDWLARQNPDWEELFPTSEAVDWETGTFAQRLQLLHQHRRSQPLVGLAWLEKTWRLERAEHRLRFLESLRSGLSLADEALLEQALGDKSRAVQSLAYRLLLLLPDSRLRQNIQHLLKSDFSKKNAELLPAKSLREAGFWSNIRLLAISPDQSTEPLESWLLLAPPEDLAAAAGQSPEAFLDRFFTSHAEYENIAAALLDNIVWRNDPAWLRAAARYFHQHPEHLLWNSEALKKVLFALPEADWVSLLAALAKHEQLLETEQSALVQALLVSDYSWPPLLVEALAYYPVRSEQPRHWSPPRHLRALLERAAYRCPVGLIDRIFVPDRDCPFVWQQALGQFRAVLAFRKAMQQALAGP